MPLPPPPPPPPAPLSGPPPPPPALPAFGGGGAKKGGNSAQPRDQLLQSIRQGKALKKTVTNDKSSPLINNNSPKTPVSSNGTVNNVKMNSSIAARTPIDLANLFAGGMPTLKQTGLRGRGSLSTPVTPPPNNASPVSVFNQTTVNNSPSNINTLSTQQNNSRGPLPQPPPSFPKKSTIHSSASEPVSIIPSGVGHNRTVSVPSLVSENVGSRVAPPGGHGKPYLAPKPPSKNKPTLPIKQCSATNLVNRANSMREPKTPPVISNNQSLQFNNLTIKSKNQPAFHLSQDSILKNPDNLKNTHLGYRTLRPIKHPTDKPPPPPIKAPLNPPAFAPPPPPPPHRSTIPPPPPPNVPPHKSYQSNNVSNGVPPTPPTRYSSMRNGQTSVLNESLLEQMEMKFSNMFKPISMIPPPPTFQRVDKIYNSRLVVSKHRAPKPPGY